MRKPVRDEVRIAELKARFSEYLRVVRRGREIVIKDRETPIARLAPIEGANPVLGIVPAVRSAAQAMKMLRSAPWQPELPPGAMDKAIEENKRDLYDKWTGGELT